MSKPIARLAGRKREVAAGAAKPLGNSGNVFLVNAGGIVHEMSRADAQAQIRADPRCRIAAPSEIDAYRKAEGHQLGYKPLAAPFVPVTIGGEVSDETFEAPEASAD